MRAKGFSLTEAMVSMAIVSVMAVGLFYLVSRSSDARKTEDLRIKLLQQAKLIEGKIRQDLTVAVRPTGNTRRAFAGMKILDLPEGNPRNGGLAILTERFGQFSTQAEVSVINNDETKPAITIKVPPNDLSAQYIQAALEKHKLFLIANTEYTNIIRIIGAPSEVGSNPTRIMAPIGNFNFTRSEHSTNSTSTIRTLEVVVYYVHDAKALREVWSDIPNENSQPRSTQVLAEGVSEFAFNYSFEDRRDAELILPDRRLTNPRLHRISEGCSPNANQNCCSIEEENDDRCVTMNDVRDLKLSATYYAEQPKLKAQPGRDGDGFEYLAGLMRFSNESVFIPLRYALKGGSIGLVGQSLDCPLNDMQSRCNPDCTEARGGPFKNRVLNSDGSYPSDWWEYGDVDSNYCKCWNINGTQIRDETRTSLIPSWNPAGPAMQNINYCAKYYPSCAVQGGESWLMSKNPPSKLACWCVQPVGGTYWKPTGPIYSRDVTASSPTYGEFKLTLERDLGTSGHPLADINSNVGSENNMRCYLFTHCDAPANLYFTNMTNPTPWGSKCECSLRELNADGNPSGDIHRINVDFNKVCNSDYFQGISQNPKCPASVDIASNKLRLRSATNTQGLTEQDAAFCSCYNEKGYNTQNNPGGNGYSLDFRSGEPLQDPQLAPGVRHTYSVGAGGGTHNTFGGRQTLATSTTAVRIDNGTTTEVAVGGNCDRLYCDIRHHAGIDLGCCSANRPVQWTVPVMTQRPALASVLNRTTGLNPGDWSSYVGYCSPECTGGKTINIPGRGNVDEIVRVREIITGTAPGGTIPPICGSWDWVPNSSSGN